MTTVDRPGARRRNRKRLLAHLPLALVAVATLFPFYVMTVLSLQKGSTLSLPGALLPLHLNLGAYTEVLAHASVLRWLERARPDP